MDAIRKRFGPKKEVPRKIDISLPLYDPNVRFGPGKIVYVEPRRPEKLDPFSGPPYPSYDERTDHSGHLNRTKNRDWKEALENKNFPIVPPADTTTTFPHNFTTLEDFEFRLENDPPHHAPSYQEELKRYPPTHHSERLYGPPLPPAPPPKDPRKPSKPRHQNAEAGPSKPAGAPRLADVLQKPDYDKLTDNLTPEQKKDLLPPPIQHTGRHARLRDNLAKSKAAKIRNEQQPLENSFVSNSVSTPAPDSSYRVRNEEAIYRPGKPTLASKLKFKLSSSRRADENSASTPNVNHSSAPLPRQPRPAATHGRTPSRNAVYYTEEDLRRAADMGRLWTRHRTASMSSRMEPFLSRTKSMSSRMESSQFGTKSMTSGMESAPQPQPQQDPAPVASSSHVRSDSSSSTHRDGWICENTLPLRIRKRNVSTSSNCPSQSHPVLDSRDEGPPPVMRHRDLIDTSRPPVIQRPGRLDSLPINTRSKNAKEEYFTPPPARVSIDPIDGSRTPSASEFGALPRRNHSTSSSTAPSRLMRGSSSYSHSQSLRINPEMGLPPHPAIHLGERHIRRANLG